MDVDTQILDAFQDGDDVVKDKALDAAFNEIQRLRNVMNAVLDAPGIAGDPITTIRERYPTFKGKPWYEIIVDNSFPDLSAIDYQRDKISALYMARDNSRLLGCGWLKILSDGTMESVDPRLIQIHHGAPLYGGDGLGMYYDR